MALPLNFRIALSSLKAHKWRAILAMLGVFLGALAFTGVQHVSKIMVRRAEIETEKLGPNSYAVVAGNIRFRRSGGARITAFSRNFTVGDAKAVIDGVPSVMEGTPYVNTTMQVRGNGNAVTAKIMASWPNYQVIRNFFPENGRFFDWEDVEERNKVCVLGQKIAERLFGSADAAIGETVYLFRASFRVLGVMEAKGRDVAGEDQDEYLFIPLETFMRRASNQDWISGVFLRLSKDAGLEQVEESATAIMRMRHNIKEGQKDDFATMSPKDAMRLQRQALDLMTTLGGITSTISFGVGGLGILSIMILVVRSRRIEIGVRRAVGGRRQDIIRQFLFESALMAGIGGAFGVLATVVLVTVGCNLADLPLIIDANSLITTLVGSCVLGIAAGAYPAWQAANIEILDVLKI
ncbi:ABC transporter permease [Pseudodesulfovibrio sp. zrk46]|uniref:ABC transporter permease n=1 Tax=Pseudodesulfovibrio sp. zrk46 TaxID=2725288 RepID=UPI001449CF15|nr:ABC transporter permease [Pseudodesulfovibrio sp. zrk46]QJB56022.1 ABC transporter permease [Pseudodesulfovibrio sp. zrk46]